MEGSVVTDNTGFSFGKLASSRAREDAGFIRTVFPSLIATCRHTQAHDTEQLEYIISTGVALPSSLASEPRGVPTSCQVARSSMRPKLSRSGLQ